MAFLRYLAAPYSARTAGELTFLLLGLPFGVLWFTYAVTMYALSVGLLILWVGFGIFVAAQVSMRWIGAVERAQVNGLLRESIATPPRLAVEDRPGSAGARAGRWALALLHDGVAWRAFAWSCVRVVSGPIGFAIALVALVLPLSLVFTFAVVVSYEVGWVDVGSAELSTLLADGGWRWGYAALPLAVLVTPALTLAARAFATFHASLARWALGPRESAAAREATARAERAEEQLRIDQELHDSIGHMITMNIVQAGAGAHVFDSDPEFARQALRNIEERGRAAMGELDRIIAHLRGDSPAERAPLPTIDDIAGLVDASRTSGADVTASIDAGDVPPAVGRAVFGIVREALTNAAKHAPGAPVEVRVARDGDAVGVAVVNGRAPARDDARPAYSTGRGLGGIRDRVTLLGGTTRIGPVDGGFEVLALVPLASMLGPEGADGSPWRDLRERVTA